jgi:hypothetical protein
MTKAGFYASIPAINSGKHNLMACDFHFKERVLLPSYKQQACCAVRRYVVGQKSNETDIL